MAAGNWTTLDRTLAYDGAPFVQVWRERVQLPDGRVLDDYHHLWTPDGVIILVSDPEGRVLVHDEYRHGVGGRTLGFPAGRLDAGETPLDAAKRELLEETGYDAASWTQVAQYKTSGTYGLNTMHVVEATGARKIAAATETDYEAPEGRWVTAADVQQALDEGKFKAVGYACAALHWLVRRRNC